MAGGQHAAFGKAARRHFDDAQLLHGAGRFANADHLAGVAAECALKAVLMEFLGGTLNQKGRPSHSARPSGGAYSHLPGLWSDIAAAAHGRTSAVFSSLISGQNPFDAWNIAERYSDGEHIDPRRAGGHIDSASRILAIYQRAEIDGAIS
ncbi:hypothetical protein [Amycolatopsis magusensis]|uniref:hypothetical protein n=1 Tax=Amycolatopsis magusensis TaxID=882444 RepID=UPI0037960B8E